MNASDHGSEDGVGHSHGAGPEGRRLGSALPQMRTAVLAFENHFPTLLARWSSGPSLLGLAAAMPSDQSRVYKDQAASRKNDGCFR